MRVYTRQKRFLEESRCKILSDKVLSAETIRPSHTEIDTVLKKFPVPFGVSRKKKEGRTHYGLSLDKNCIAFNDTDPQTNKTE